MDRRHFLKILIAGGTGALLNRTLGKHLPIILSGSRYLPPYQVNTFSSEIVMNSRRSYHSGYSGSLSDQVLANILWAASRAPMTGTNRIIYVARSDNVYRYDPVAHDIIMHQSGNHMSESNCAFEVGVAGDLAEDAGAALHYAHLASISFWQTTSSQPSGCPKESATTNANNSWNPAMTVQMVNCHGFMSTVSGITSTLVAISSDGSLPDPLTDGSVLLEDGLSNLHYGDQFSSDPLTLNELSQLAWASYGNTPHTAAGGRAALVAASAVANYYLTGRIYIVRPEGVERYHIRLPSGQTTTRDHRIERVTDGDRRSQLRSAVPRIPQTAPDYFVYCATTADRWQLIEAGYSSAGALLQATSLNLQGYSTANFSSAERNAIIGALGIPATDLPLVIFSTGQEYVGINDEKHHRTGIVGITPNPFTHQTRITCEVTSPAGVYLSIYDESGRLVRKLDGRAYRRGKFTVVWNGKDDHGINLPEGTYFAVLKTGKKEHIEKIVKTQ